VLRSALLALALGGAMAIGLGSFPDRKGIPDEAASFAYLTLVCLVPMLARLPIPTGVGKVIGENAGKPDGKQRLQLEA
jgi:hypothetical protein